MLLNSHFRIAISGDGFFFLVPASLLVGRREYLADCE
jgi:hypothetical protein